MLLFQNAIKSPQECVAHARDIAFLRSNAHAVPPAALHNDPDAALSAPASPILKAQAHYFVSGLRNCVALAGIPTCSLLAALVVQILVANLSKIEN